MTIPAMRPTISRTYGFGPAGGTGAGVLGPGPGPGPALGVDGGGGGGLSGGVVDKATRTLAVPVSRRWRYGYLSTQPPAPEFAALLQRDCTAKVPELSVTSADAPRPA